MIGRLKGVLLEKQAPYLLLDVHGVGYEMQASMTTFYRLPDINREVILYTHFIVREDAQLLYGFYNIQERTLFRDLIKVNGVGPKLALTILSSIEPADFMACVNQQDSSRLVRLPGVGKKTADRLIIEMRDKISDQIARMEFDQSIPLTSPSAQQDAISALLALGYKLPEANHAIKQIANLDTLNSEAIIRAALKNLTL